MNLPRLPILCCLAVLLTGPVYADSPTRFLDDSLPVHEPVSRAVVVQHLDLEVRLDLDQGTIQGTATYRGQVRHQAEALVLQAVNVDVQQAEWLTGDKSSPAAFEKDGEDLRFRLPRHGETTRGGFALRFRFVATPKRGLYFVRPSPDAPDRPLHAWTQGETDETRHWLPGPSEPDQRMTWDVAVTAPATMKALSNGRQQGRTVQGSLATTRWHVAKPVPLYLLTLAVGPFVEVVHRETGVPVRTWTLPGQKDDVAKAFAPLPAMVDFFAQRLGVPYPWGQYGQVVAGDFHFGGMENVSLTTLDARAVPDVRASLDWQADSLAAHELAHQWFGDLVTCRTWGDAWLNEGFASYGGALWFEHAVGPDRLAEGLDVMRQSYLGEASEYLRPVVTDRYRDEGELFDRHTYNKGAWVLHMLRRKLGDEAFFAGVQTYLKRGPASVETDDLRADLEQASGQSLRAFFQRWLRQAGHPVLTAKVRYDVQAHVLVVDFEQTQKAGPGLPLFDLAIEIAVRNKASDVAQVSTFRLTQARGTFSLPLPARPEVVELDPRSAVLADWTVQAGPDELAAMRDFGSTAEVRLRAVRDLGRDLKTAKAVQALQRALASDPARHVRTEAARLLGRGDRAQVRQALAQAASADREPRVRAAALVALGELHDGQAWALLEKAAIAEPSYDVQKAALRALVVIDRRRARPVLLQALGQTSFRAAVQVVALGLLGPLADANDRERLWNATLAGQGEPMREGGVLALAAYGVRVEAAREDIRLHLEGMLHEPNMRIRRATAQALGMLGEPASRAALTAAADRELEPRTADTMRRQLEGLGRRLTADERIKRLEELVDRLQREGEKKDAGHAPEATPGPCRGP